MALSVFFNRLGSGTIALTFLSLKEAVGTFASFSLYAESHSNPNPNPDPNPNPNPDPDPNPNP